MTALLVLEHVSAGYGPTVVLDELSLQLAEGEACAVLGRNGVGKSTLLRTIMGHTRLHSGTIFFSGRDIGRLAAYRRARAGIGLVPQEREVFPSLTVEENLAVGLRDGEHRRIEEAWELFPRLAERRRNMGTQLSGGEQQMLSIARALMGNPRLILMDEPLEGLAPVVIEQLLAAMARLRARGPALLLVEQHARRALEFAERAVILDRGRIVHDGASAGLRGEPERLARLMGVTAGAR